MNKKYLDDPPRLKKLMEFWFLKRNVMTYDEVDGTDVFTLFDKAPALIKENILSQFELTEAELAVFILTVEASTYIINTTHRFIRLQKDIAETIEYADFSGHAGFKSFFPPGAGRQDTINVKKEGHFDDFGLRLKTGEIIYWRIPTGKPGFGFWNVTKRCRLD